MLKMLILLFLIFFEYVVKVCDHFEVNKSISQENNDLLLFCLGRKGNSILEIKISEHFGLKKILKLPLNEMSQISSDIWTTSMFFQNSHMEER